MLPNLINYLSLLDTFKSFYQAHFEEIAPETIKIN